MNVIKIGEKYRCNICGNIVVVEQVGGGELSCCGEPMESIDEGDIEIEEFEKPEEELDL
jgi:desulfoferrodoxin-like iron-binding protein